MARFKGISSRQADSTSAQNALPTRFAEIQRGTKRHAADAHFIREPAAPPI
jgi:hypothetical protein